MAVGPAGGQGAGRPAAPWRRLAAGAEVPVFAALGAGAEEALDRLRLAPGIVLVGSPRHAALLLAAGGLPAGLWSALQRVHDQLAHPRATVRWGAPLGPALPAARRVPLSDEVAPALRRTYRELLTGARASDAARLVDAPPSPWRGLGDHGQGGRGMMGGRPYGRPLARTADDLRDGLALDALTLRLGPFLPELPPGLVLRVTLQGDVVQGARVESPPFPQVLPEPFVRAQRARTAVAELELARARHHLRRVARVLRALGLGPLAQRALGMARRAAPGRPEPVAELRRRMHRAGVFRALGPGVLRLERAVVEEGGPAARAVGAARDARSADPAYRRIGFRTHTETGGDLHARLRQRLAEAAEALVWAGRAAAAEVTTTPDAPLEGPWGPLGWTGAGRELAGPPDASAAVAARLPGLAFDEARVALAELDLGETAAEGAAATGGAPG